jgi:hypothetical protein
MSHIAAFINNPVSVGERSNPHLRRCGMIAFKRRVAWQLGVSHLKRSIQHWEQDSKERRSTLRKAFREKQTTKVHSKVKVLMLLRSSVTIAIK